jgi:hypothetical protein
VDFEEKEDDKKDVIKIDTLEKIATIFAFASSIIAFFMKFGSVIKMPHIPWPRWVLGFADFLSSLITQALSFFPSLPDFDAQTTSILNGIVPFLLFPMLWRYFRSTRNFPGFVACWQSFPAIFYGFIAFASAAKGFASDNNAVGITFWVMIALVIFPFVLLLIGFSRCKCIKRCMDAEDESNPTLLFKVLVGPCYLFCCGGDFNCFPRFDILRFFRNDNPIYHIISIVIDVAIVAVIGLAATDSDAFHFPTSELCSILVVLFIVFAVFHLLVLLIFFLRRNQVDSVIRGFLDDHGVRILFLWSSLFFGSAITSVVHLLIEIASGCASGEFDSLVPLNDSIPSFDFLFEHDSSCVSCSSNGSDWPCSRLCSGNHAYEFGAVIPLFLFVFSVIAFGIPVLLYREIREVGERIRGACIDFPDARQHESRLQNWRNILSTFHDSAVEFVKPFRYGAFQWPLWQLLNPVIPSIIEEISSSGYDIGGEIILMIYSLIGLVTLFWFSPFPDRLATIENVILEITNVVLSLIPVIHRYFTPLSELFLSACGIVGVGVPVILMIVLVIVETHSSENPHDEVDKSSPPFVQMEGSLLSAKNDFVNRRNLSLLDQLRLCYACSKIHPLAAIEWLKDA